MFVSFCSRIHAHHVKNTHMHIKKYVSNTMHTIYNERNEQMNTHHTHTTHANDTRMTHMFNDV
jgi:hypothetical protein